MHSTRIFACLVALLFCTAGCSAFTFETKEGRMTIDESGSVTELVYKPTNLNILTDARPFCYATVGGVEHPVNALHLVDGSYEATFDGLDGKAVFAITTSDAAVDVQLKAVPDGIDGIVLLRAPVKSIGTSGSLLVTRFNDTFGVVLMPTSINVHPEMDKSGAFLARTQKDLGLTGGTALIIASRGAIMDDIHAVEVADGIPFTHIDGMWSKVAPINNRGYLFTDVSVDKVDNAIAAAKKADLGGILFLNSSWTKTQGSYVINTANFPNGESDVKAAVDRIHAAGLYAGVHVYTDSVSWEDTLATPVPSPYLLKDLSLNLAGDIDEKTSMLNLGEPTKLLPAAHPLAAGDKLVIDDEIVIVRSVANGVANCARGANKTVAAPHSSGAKVTRLVQVFGMGIADLRSPLKDTVADRIAAVINNNGFDMVYFDAQGIASLEPYWYWGPYMEDAVCRRVTKDLLLSGGLVTPWGWHLLSRGTADDFAAIEPNAFLDSHKAQVILYYTTSLLPGELGWVGMLAGAADHPATTPDEIEHLGIRMIAHNMPVGLETMASDMANNGRTDENLTRLGVLEDTRLAGVDAATRKKLMTGEWEMVGSGKAATFVPRTIVSVRPTSASGNVTNPYSDQAPHFRLTAAKDIPASGGKQTVLATDVDVPQPKANYAGIIGVSRRFPAKSIVGRTALSVEIDVEGTIGDTPAVLNFQLEAAGGMLRDYMLPLDFTGKKTIVIDRPDGAAALTTMVPDGRAYNIKRSVYTFDQASVTGVSFRWMRQPSSDLTVHIDRVSAQEVTATPLINPVITVGSTTLQIPVTLQPGAYAEWMGGESIHLYDPNGKLYNSVPAPTASWIMPAGSNAVSVASDNTGPWELKLFLHG